MTHRTRIFVPAWGAASALALCASLAGAQTPKGVAPAPTQPTPTYRTLSPEVMKAMFGDAVDPQSPVPGLTYTPHQMAKRLMEIAEGPVPTREALEKEFGFQFQLQESTRDVDKGLREYYATAPSPPFATPLGPRHVNISYYEFRKTTLIAFNFEGDQRGFNKTEVRQYCVPGGDFSAALKKSWQKHRRVLGGHHPDVIEYKTNISGLERAIEVAPTDLSSSLCITGLYIQYHTQPKQFTPQTP